jgi:hypothetical protein
MQTEAQLANLLPQSLRSPEERRAISAKGGKKSGEAKRKQREFADIAAKIIAGKIRIKGKDGKPFVGTIEDVLGRVLYGRSDSAKVKLIELLWKATGGTEKLDITGLAPPVINIAPPPGYTPPPGIETEPPAGAEPGGRAGEE